MFAFIYQIRLNRNYGREDINIGFGYFHVAARLHLMCTYIRHNRPARRALSTLGTMGVASVMALAERVRLCQEYIIERKRGILMSSRSPSLLYTLVKINSIIIIWLSNIHFND